MNLELNLTLQLKFIFIRKNPPFSVYDLRDNPARYFYQMGVLSDADISLVIKTGVHFQLYGGAILFLVRGGHIWRLFLGCYIVRKINGVDIQNRPPPIDMTPRELKNNIQNTCPELTAWPLPASSPWPKSNMEAMSKISGILLAGIPSFHLIFWLPRYKNL